MSYAAIKKEMTFLNNEFRELVEKVDKTYQLLTEDPNFKQQLDDVGISLSRVDVLIFGIVYIGRVFELSFSFTPGRPRPAAISLHEKIRGKLEPALLATAYLDSTGSVYMRPEDKKSTYALSHKSIVEFLFEFLRGVLSAA